MTPVAHLQHLAARSWPAAEVEQLGGWTLRASAGVTKRANSVLPLGDPGLPLGPAVDRVERWYADRALPAHFQTFPGAGPAGLEPCLDELGYVRFEETVFMTGPVPAGASSVGPALSAAVELSADPDDEWLAALDAAEPTRWRSDLRGELLRRVTPIRRHAAIRVGGRIVAVGRCVVDDGWVGFAALATAADHRRQGHGRSVLAALAGWAAESGAGSAYIQVVADNQPAVALYRSVGFAEHHRYAYYVRQTEKK